MYRVVLVVLLAMLTAFAQAADQRAFSYEYDDAGNLIRIRASLNTGPPVIIDVLPALANINTTVPVIVTGLDLFLADVSASPTELIVSNVESISNTEVRFDVFVVAGGLGDRSFTITTALGSASAAISVAERIPIIALSPAPLILLTGESRTVAVRLDAPYSSDVTLNLVMGDGAIAALPAGGSPTALDVFLPVGTTEFTFEVQANAIGATSLEITQLDNVQVSTLAVQVIAEPALPEGSHIGLSQLVGVRRSALVQAGESVESISVGVSRRILVKAGESVESGLVGVEKL